MHGQSSFQLMSKRLAVPQAQSSAKVEQKKDDEDQSIEKVDGPIYNVLIYII